MKKIYPLPYRSAMSTPQGMATWQRAFEEWKDSLNSNSDDLPQFATVSDVDSPDLSAYAGSSAGNPLFVTDGIYFTIYAWDTSSTANSPYVVAGDGGYWVAIAGRYINHAGRVNSLTASRLAGTDVDKGIVSVNLYDWITVVANRTEKTDNLDGTIEITTPDDPEIIDFTNADHSHQDAAGAGQLDHGSAMTAASLLDDDHTQYHTDARGDARYYTQAQVDVLVSVGINSILCADGDVLVGDDGVLYGW